MAHFQIRRLSDNAILGSYEADSPQPQKYAWERSNPRIVIHEPMPQVDIDAKLGDAMWDAVRDQRNGKLSADIDGKRHEMVWGDAKGGGSAWNASKKVEWADYRQALLDVPESIQADIDNGGHPLTHIKDLDLANYSWPVKPAS